MHLSFHNRNIYSLLYYICICGHVVLCGRTTCGVYTSPFMLSSFFSCQVPLLVINYDLPNNPELYIRRIGCSGPQGRKVNIYSIMLYMYQLSWMNSEIGDTAWPSSVQGVDCQNFFFLHEKYSKHIILLLMCKIEKINNILFLTTKLNIKNIYCL